MRIDSSGNVGIGTSSPTAGKVVINSTQSGTEKQLALRDATNGWVRKIGVDTSNNMGFFSGDTEQMRIDSSGNVGINITPEVWSTTNSTRALQISSRGSIWANVNSTSINNNWYLASGDVSKYIDTAAATRYVQDATGIHQWFYAASGSADATMTLTEAMRIDTSGNVGIGTSTPAVPLEVVGQIRSSGSTARAMYIFGAAGVKPYLTINEFGVRDWDLSAGNFSSGTFSIQSGGSNGVYLNGAAATSWSSASDERVKTDLKPIENAATKVSTLRAVTGRYKTDEVGVSRSFLIAQDVQAVLPEAVGAAVMSDGSEVLGLAYTEVIPLLVAAIKELKAEIDLLKGN
jgi:hypothetical protein